MARASSPCWRAGAKNKLFVNRHSNFASLARAGSPCHGKARGFTLVELVLVMLVIAVVVAMVAPSFHGANRGRRAGDTASQIVSLASYARSQAITQGKTYRLNLDPDAGTYELSKRDYDVFEVMGNWSYSTPDGVRIACDLQPQQDGLYIEFRPTGRTDPAIIRVSDDDGMVIEVICESATELFHVADTK